MTHDSVCMHSFDIGTNPSKCQFVFMAILFDDKWLRFEAGHVIRVEWCLYFAQLLFFQNGEVGKERIFG